MRILTYTEVRANLRSVIGSTVGNAEVTVIQRRDGEDAILIGRDAHTANKRHFTYGDCQARCHLN